MSKVIIVESPAKSKTIQNYVGGDSIVLSSKGHIRDLAISGVDGLGIDLETFAPNYKVLDEKKSLVNDLIKKTKGKEVLIATDPDREGEAIGWHLAEVLNLDLDASNRIIFREITRSAVQEALKSPRKIDMSLVESQEARRIIDRIIGFKLSKLLQRKIKSKSAGRVQSVALKLIVDLEKEIRAFIPITYYEIEATFKDFVADYIIKGKERLTKSEADLIVAESTNPFIVTNIEKKDSIRPAKPAFITSTLQQDAITNLNMSSDKVMRVAQSLYEGIEVNGEKTGLITYMRTDSTRLSSQFVSKAFNVIEERYGKEYKGFYKTTKDDKAQDAHEAIRPSNLDLRPDDIKDYLSKDEYKLYKRIYDRALASLMSAAKYEITKVVLTTNNHDYLLEGSKLIFDGHQKVYQENKKNDKLLPDIKLGDSFNALSVEAIEKTTQPKARYTEATLIKEMESLGIGRPSTYATVISTLLNRNYVEFELGKEVEYKGKKIQKKGKHFIPTDQGILTSEQLDLFFSNIINVDYTSRMETALDAITEGNRNGTELIKNFYNSFTPLVDKATKEMVKIEPKELEENCPLCGKPLVIRKSKYGEFAGCSGFPKCKYIKK